MIKLFDGTFHAYSMQGFIFGPGTFYQEGNCFAGQRNGLMGVTQPNVMHLTFGMHTGPVQMTITLEEKKPALDPQWEEVVEASFVVDESVFPEDWEEQELPIGPAPAGHGFYRLSECGGKAADPFLLPYGTYRVRFSAKNFGLASDQEVQHDDSGVPIEKYELTFWPEVAAADEVIRATSKAAQHWHLVAQGLAK